MGAMTFADALSATDIGISALFTLSDWNVVSALPVTFFRPYSCCSIECRDCMAATCVNRKDTKSTHA